MSRAAMIISKDSAVLLRSISTAPEMVTQLLSRKHRFLKGWGVGGSEESSRAESLLLLPPLTHLPNLLMSGPATSDPSKPPMQKMETMKDQMRETCQSCRETPYLRVHVSFTSCMINCNRRCHSQ